MGSRPEVIKLAPVYFALKEVGAKVSACASFQQANLSKQALKVFGIEPDFKMDVMVPGQSLVDLSCKLLSQFQNIYKKVKPALVVVQGDTATALCAGMSAFLLKIPVAHVEAGLRTGVLSSPFPEEANRQALRIFSSLHFAPTEIALQNLFSEGVDESCVFKVGNTVVDALKNVLERIEDGTLKVSDFVKDFVEENSGNGQKIVVLTLHRREGFDGGIKRACHVIGDFVAENKDISVVYPRHPNPNVKDTSSWLKTNRFCDRILLCDPLAYVDMVYLLSMSTCIVTDSGGLQEEGVSLGKRVVCVREVTERTEGISDGLICLTGFDENKILSALEQFCSPDKITSFKGVSKSVFGDGLASPRIVRILQSKFPSCF
ncbi:non-hydrolyzing UDP-N-acetylglucosamine 2-epimerase [Candidatus Dependentiae bacterium]